MSGGGTRAAGTTLSADDALAVLDAVRAATDARDLDELAGVVTTTVRQLVPSNGVGYNEVDPRGERITYLTDPADFVPDDFPEIWERLAYQHPIYAHQQRTGDGSPRTISDFLTQDEWHDLELYTELYARANIEFQIAFGLPAPQPLIVAVAVTREDRDFDARDRAVLEAYRPHLMQAYRIVRTQAELRDDLGHVLATFAADGRHLAFVEPGGLRFPSDESAAMFERWIDDVDDLDAWLRAQRRRFDGAGVPLPLEPFSLVHGDTRLLIRYLGGSGHPDALVLTERPDTPDLGRLEALGLSPREARVLAQLTGGGSTASIASELGVSAGTVRKHLERVYRKFGVQTRTQAVAAAFEALADP